MNAPGTMQTGPLGSTIHVLRADAETIVELAALDWNRQFRRVCLDPVRGVITLMSPSRLHEDLASIFDDIVRVAGSTLAGATRTLRSPRLRGQGEPPGTGMEPDCAFYVGDRARGYRAALREGATAADAYLESIAPDLVVEAEITSADAGKAERYGEMGVRELWRLHGRQGTQELQVEFFALSTGTAPRALDASEILEGLTSADICEAVDGVRFSLTDEESREAVARVVRRRRRASVRVREEEGGTYQRQPEEHTATTP
ncbi:MAG: Uma2 family endonuclease [Thiotrichales bacterium]|nr:Uma2 family endonuclease [Thiotrichales bacterium]